MSRRQPRAVAGGREVPLQLEAACLKAIAKDPDERYGSADELHADVMEWFEAEAERAKRHELAEAKAAEGKAMLEEYERLKKDVKRLEAEAKEVESASRAGSQRRKRPSSLLPRTSASEARRIAWPMVKAASTAVATLEKALGFEDDNASAPELHSPTTTGAVSGGGGPPMTREAMGSTSIAWSLRRRQVRGAAQGRRQSGAELGSGRRRGVALRSGRRGVRAGGAQRAPPGHDAARIPSS